MGDLYEHDCGEGVDEMLDWSRCCREVCKLEDRSWILDET